jgi:glycine cleavage system H protein
MDTRYSEDHYWVRRRPNTDVVTVGLSVFAQQELGEVTFLQLPEIGARVERDQPVCAIESLKSASEIYAPVSGIIESINEDLGDAAGLALLNSDPLGGGWLFSMHMEEPTEFDALLDPEEYSRRTASGE